MGRMILRTVDRKCALLVVNMKLVTSRGQHQLCESAPTVVEALRLPGRLHFRASISAIHRTPPIVHHLARNTIDSKGIDEEAPLRRRFPNVRATSDGISECEEEP